MNDEDKGFVDIWGDHVKIKDLGISMFLCIALALGGFILAPDEPPKPLIYGLVGGAMGFIISSVIIKPKRNISKMEGEE